MTDSTVVVPTQASGPKIDVSEVTRADGTLVERQRANISDPENPDSHARVFGEAGKGKLSTSDDVLLQVLLQIAGDLREIKEKFQTIKF